MAVDKVVMERTVGVLKGVGLVPLDFETASLWTFDNPVVTLK